MQHKQIGFYIEVKILLMIGMVMFRLTPFCQYKGILFLKRTRKVQTDILDRYSQFSWVNATDMILKPKKVKPPDN